MGNVLFDILYNISNFLIYLHKIWWKFWGRKRFCEELLKAVPDISVARPESSANFVELIAQVVNRFDLADPSVEEGVDQTIQAIVHRFPDATPAQHLRHRQDLDIETSRTAN